MVSSRHMKPDHDTASMGDQVRFQTTRWNLVQSSKDVAALDALIKIYWKPLYFFIRQHGHDNETAKDLVQAFLVKLLERDAFTKADPSRGKFRTFLLASLANFMKDWSKAASREKRGSGVAPLSLDFARGEAEYIHDVPQGELPEAALNRAWAKSLWEQSLSELDGESAHLEAFKLYLSGLEYKTIAEKAGLSESATKSAVHRLKGRLRDVVVGHIKETVSSEADLQAEVSEFMSLLRE